MTHLIPVREIAHQRLALPAHDRWTEELTWIPAAATEIHLASRYYPVAARIEDRKPRLGLIVDLRYLAHAPLDSAGAWRGYRPIGLRCFPFQATSELSGDPLSDILIETDSEYVSSSSGTPIIDDTGRPGRLLTELHRLFKLLHDGEESFVEALDQYLMAGLLTPLTELEDSAPHPCQPLYVINPARLVRTENAALAAMTRHRFRSIDLAITCQFSLQNLRPKYRPKETGRSASDGIDPELLAMDTTMIGMSLALDDGELISIADMDIARQ